jgi:hypothetical protein
MLPRTRSSKRAIAVLAAMVLMLCQAAFIAQACAKIGAAGEVAVSPCHATGDTNVPAPAGDHVRPGCEAPALTAEAVSVPFGAGIFFVAVSISLQPFHISDGAPSIGLRGQKTHCRPPPFTILHCRFLN